MRKQVFGRKFKRDSNERKALFKGLASSLVLSERITTTEEKAKAIKGHVEKLVTKAKRGGRQAEMLLEPFLSKEAMAKMLSDVAPRFSDRPGGYTRVIKTGSRLKDNAHMAFIEWVEKSAKGIEQSPKRDVKKVVTADAAVAAAIHGGKETVKKEAKKVATKKKGTRAKGEGK